MATSADTGEPPPDSPITWIRKLTHELGNAVWAISGYSELLQRGLKREEGAEVTRDLDAVAVAADRLQLLSAQIRMAAFCAGKLKDAGDHAELSRCYERLRHRLLTRAPEHSARLPGSVPEAGAAIDPALLEALLEQLLSNCLEFTRGPILIDVSGTPETLVLRLTDSGPVDGEIAPEQWLEPFHSSVARLGLGATLARALAQELGGALSGSPVAGGGVRWSVELPASDVLSGGEADTQGEASDGPCLLYVDDQPVNRTLIERALVAAGWRVSVAGHGEEGLRSLDSKVPDLVLTDLHMPVMDGFEFSRKVRERHPGLPIVAFSASTSDERAVPAEDRALFDEFIVKSGEIEALDGIFRKLLDLPSGPGTRAAPAEAPPPEVESRQADEAGLPGELDELREALTRLSDERNAEERVAMARRLLETVRELSTRLDTAGAR